MLIPYDESLGVHPQAESFTEHELWDFERRRPDQYPLLLHFPYFDLYRKQVVKQADLVLAMHLRGDAFTDEQKARNFDYYERLTVRDSSLSACTQAVIAAEVGHLELAYDYFGEAALMDLDDLEHNTRDGVHIASLAGAWIARGRGLRRHARPRRRAQLQAAAARPDHPPAVPTELPRATAAGRRRHERATYTLLDGPALEITHHDQTATIGPDEPVTLDIPPVPRREPPTQPAGRVPARRRKAARPGR